MPFDRTCTTSAAFFPGSISSLRARHLGRPLNSVVAGCLLAAATMSVSTAAHGQAAPQKPAQAGSSAPVVLPKPLPEVQAILDKANAAFDTSKLSEAEALYRQALALAQGKADNPGEGRALHGIGSVYKNTGRFADSLTAYQQALSLYRSVGDKDGEAWVLANIGVVYGLNGHPSDAIASLQQVLPLMQSAGDKRGEAAVLKSIGWVYGSTNRPSEAVTAYQQALPLYRSAGDKAGEAAVLTSIGEVYEGTARPADALTAYQQALPLYRNVGDKAGEAAVLSSIGWGYGVTGRPSKALTVYQQALTLFQSVGNKDGEAWVLNGIGSAYSVSGRSSDALAMYQQSLTLFQSVGNKDGEANEMLNIGFAYIGSGRLSDALASLQQALPLTQDVGNKRDEAKVRMNIGRVYDSTGRPSDALIAFQQALPLFQGIGDKDGEAKVLANTGIVYADTGRPADALTAFQQALPLFQSAGEKGNEAGVLSNIALVEKKQGHWEAALASYARAIDLIEQLRTNLGGYTASKQSFLTVTRGRYTNYLDCLLTAPDASATHTLTAFTLSEQTKARSLLDLLDSGQVDLNAALSDDDKAQLRDLRQQSDALNTQMVQEGVENNVGAKARFAAIQQQQRDVESKLQRLTDTLYAKHPDLAEKRAATTATAADLAPLLDKNTALLEYVKTTPRHLALFVVTKGDTGTSSSHVTAHYLTIPATLAADCAAFQTACADPRKDYATLATKLYETLIAPATPELAGKTRLIVCPDGPLWNVPFQALTDKNGKFLADHAEIDYAYSATGALAAYNARERQKSQQAAAGEGSLLVLANPSFGDAGRFGDLDGLPGQRPIERPSRPMERPSRPMEAPSRPIEAPSRAMAETLARGGHIAPLPGTQREADALKALFPDATVLTGENAQEETVKKDAPNYRYLHFATHGFFNDAAPMLSSLVLAQPDAADKAAGDNGFLTARDIFDLRLPNTELVTLSACNTGRGAIQSGEGVVGLTWALFAAGCPTQVVSQWSVDDAATATLMTRFYTELKGGTPKGVALHDAARSLAHDPAHRHPYYWAPFVLFGDWK